MINQDIKIKITKYRERSGVPVTQVQTKKDRGKRKKNKQTNKNGYTIVPCGYEEVAGFRIVNVCYVSLRVLYAMSWF